MLAAGIDIHINVIVLELTLSLRRRVVAAPSPRSVNLFTLCPDIYVYGGGPEREGVIAEINKFF